MKETGIIMSGSHPLDIIEGRKTMTRRTWGLERINKNPDEWVNPYQLIIDPRIWTWRSRKTGKVMTIKCPYGQVGDRLWVRETFNIIETILSPAPIPDRIVYKASPETYQGYNGIHWRSSRFMPKKFARIWREITEVRAERLQDITEEDAKAEGCRATLHGNTLNPQTLKYKETYIESFPSLWDSLNAKRGYSWESNPWVWPISFKSSCENT